MAVPHSLLCILTNFQNSACVGRGGESKIVHEEHIHERREGCDLILVLSLGVIFEMMSMQLR
jgi:hypothetical protein